MTQIDLQVNFIKIFGPLCFYLYLYLLRIVFMYLSQLILNVANVFCCAAFFYIAMKVMNLFLFSLLFIMRCCGDFGGSFHQQ